jgi:hypothetical protein
VVRQEAKGERSTPGVDRRGRRGQECTSKQERRGKGVHGQTGGKDRTECLSRKEGEATTESVNRQWERENRMQ